MVTVTFLKPVVAAVETATGTVRLVGLFTVICPTAKFGIAEADLGFARDEVGELAGDMSPKQSIPESSPAAKQLVISSPPCCTQKETAPRRGRIVAGLLLSAGGDDQPVAAGRSRNPHRPTDSRSHSGSCCRCRSH